MTRTLLDLPAEIVQHVLFLLDPSSFYICLLTNKVLRQHALQSKTLLLHHIAQVPGDRYISTSDRMDVQSLLSIFNKRAARHLFNGIPRMTDTSFWKARPSMNRSLSNIIPWYDDYACRDCDDRSRIDPFMLSRPSNKCVFLEVSEDAVLQAHCLEADWTGEGPFKVSYAIPQEFLWGHLTPASDTHDTQKRVVIQIAWQGGCPTGLEDHTSTLEVLSGCSYPTPADLTVGSTPPLEDLCGCSHTLEVRSSCSSPTLAVLSGCSNLINLELAVIKLHPHFGPRIQARYSLEAPSGAEAVAALAFTPEGDPTITWQYRHSRYHFVQYGTTTAPDGSQHLTYPEDDKSFIDTNRITHVQIRHVRTIFFARTFQMPLWVGIMHAPTHGEMMFDREDTSLPAGVAGVVTIRQGIYLAQRHLHSQREHQLCANAVLRLFISHDNYHIAPSGPALQGAYIVRTLTSVPNCDPFEPVQTYRNLYYRYVARLVDTPSFDNLPTSGLKVAVSPRARRIAMAAWRTLKVYALNPSVFLSGDRASYESADAGNAFTYCDAYPTDAWRSGYYNNWTREEEHVLIEPVEVPCSGVVHALRWVSEDELWAITDEGVCRWDFSVRARGSKTEGQLGHCVNRLGLKRGKKRIEI